MVPVFAKYLFEKAVMALVAFSSAASRSSSVIFSSFRYNPPDPTVDLLRLLVVERVVGVMMEEILQAPEMIEVGAKAFAKKSECIKRYN